MRLSQATPFSTALVLFHFFQYTFGQIEALTLSSFQEVSGFSYACTKAYNTPLTDCSISDFGGQGCSPKCIGFLDSLTNLLTNACAGTSAYQDTLIGRFLDGKGAQKLCLNAEQNSSSSGGGNGYGHSAGQNGSPTPQPAATEASPSTTSTSTSISTSSTTSTSSTPEPAATSSTTTIVPTTVSPEATTTSIAVVGTTVTPEADTAASTSTSPTKSSTSSSTTSTSTSNGNGGGTPLDIGSSASSACREAAVGVWLFALLVGLAGVSWLL